MDFPKLMKEIEDLYLGDNRPWIIGLSGGKDSTCVTQLVYSMLLKLPENKRKKEVHILTSDTLVEPPYILERVRRTCSRIDSQAKKDGLPMKVKMLKPQLNDTFWVNLIGRGYPSPNIWFRWCTDRLKIKPASKYILEHVKENGEVIILLGARKNESATRAQTMGKYAIENFRLRKHSDISGAYIYAPIEDWDTPDVWTYLLQAESPWGDNNKELLQLYKKCDAECPLVIDRSTPACGGSRFGCWVCTVVARDKAIESLIDEGETWLEPLLDFRNWLKAIRDDPAAREPMRKGDKRKKIIAERWNKEFKEHEHRGFKVLGSFTLETRHEILRRLVELHESFKGKGFPLISPEEIKAIETIWVYEGDPITSVVDVLARNKCEIVCQADNGISAQLKTICAKHDIPFELLERMLIVENDLSMLSRRIGIYSRLEKIIGEYSLENMQMKLET